MFIICKLLRHSTLVSSQSFRLLFLLLSWHFSILFFFRSKIPILLHFHPEHFIKLSIFGWLLSTTILGASFIWRTLLAAFIQNHFKVHVCIVYVPCFSSTLYTDSTTAERPRYTYGWLDDCALCTFVAKLN